MMKNVSTTYVFYLLPYKQIQSHLVQVCFLLKSYWWPSATVQSQTPRTRSSLAKPVLPLSASPQYVLILVRNLVTLNCFERNIYLNFDSYILFFRRVTYPILELIQESMTEHD